MPAHRDPPLTSDEIVATAVTLTLARGLGALSMRSLAAELGVTAMTLYHHVGDKDALTERVADAVLRGVPMPARDLTWDRWLVEYHDALWKHLRNAPSVARYLLQRPSTPGGAALRRMTVDVLVDGGFSEREALLAASTFHTHLLGRLAVQLLPEDHGRDDEPAWGTYGLTSEDYASYAMATLVAGLRSVHPVAGNGIIR